MLRCLIIVASCLLLSACGNFIKLKNELNEAKSHLGYLAGVVASPSCANCPTVLVALGDASGKVVYSYRIYERPTNFEILVLGDTKYLFVFNDLNSDFEFQPNEPCAVMTVPDGFAGGERVDHIELRLKSGNACPSNIANLFSLRGTTRDEIDVDLGKVVGLDDQRFNPSAAATGMWQPLHFMREGYAGLYFLQAYSPSKIPVLFVHGINGNPSEFAAMVASLDKEKFQPWVIYYPSGLEIGALGEGMLGMMTELHQRYGFEQLHIVAHSMGGLVSRSYISACIKHKSCRYLRSFISISSPFGGHSSAQNGVDYAPVVMPVWRSLAPGSRFLSELFKNPMPNNVPHHLLFGFHNDSIISKESSDGTISLVSQLRYEAQQQATSQRGFDENHVSILSSKAVLDHVMNLLTQTDAGLERK